MIVQDVLRAKRGHRMAIQAQQDAANEVAARQYDLDVAEALAVSALRAEDTPVTLIPKLARGDAKVAEARRALAVAEGVYRVAQARTQATYADWKFSEAQYEREWGAER